ncbi:PRD domain-containing protein [Konateibacter massiliensis]|uniref:PRD domain-containing protein n=1 Tax=Konateibacter massiliensis TaxID=2002841 RepID=UPI000C152516|nr:PRD domain-containing protein [Konateibacter massiliensis]
MKINKILNNNMVLALDDDGKNEVVVMSLGIGFKRKKGEDFPREEAQKIFVLKDEEVKGKYNELLENVDPISIEIAENIISYAMDKYKMKLNDIIHITLADHVNGMIKRLKEGINLTNQLTMEIGRIYPNEFDIGLFANQVIQEKIGTSLIRDEAAFIALQFVNNQMDAHADGQEVKTTLRFVSDVIQLVEQYFKIEIQENSFSYYRFVTHLKFLCKRIYSGDVYHDDPELFESVSKAYPKATACVEKIVHFIQLKYKKDVSTEEKAYLAIYVEKLLRDCSRQS